MEDSTLHRAHRDAQFVRDFIVMKPVQKHRERLPEIVFELGNRGLDIVDIDQGRDRIVMIILTRIQEVLILGLVDDGILKALSLVVVDEDVAHDGVQPSLDVSPFLEIVLVSKGLHKRLLNQIIGVFSVTGEAHGETRKKILMTGQQIVEFESRHLFIVLGQRLNKISTEQSFRLTFISKL